MRFENRRIKAVPSTPPTVRASRILDLVSSARDILIVGNPEPELTMLLEMRGCSVSALVTDAETANRARAVCDEVFVGGVTEKFADVVQARYDALIFDAGNAKVSLRHVCREAASVLRDGGFVISIVPNIAHAALRMAAMAGSLGNEHAAVYASSLTLSGLTAVLSESSMGIDALERIEHAVQPAPSANVSPIVMQRVFADPEAATAFFVIVARPRAGTPLPNVATEAAHDLHLQMQALTAEIEALKTRANHAEMLVEQSADEAREARARFEAEIEALRAQAGQAEALAAQSAQEASTAISRLSSAEGAKAQLEAQLQRVLAGRDELRHSLSAEIEGLRETVAAIRTERDEVIESFRLAEVRIAAFQTAVIEEIARRERAEAAQAAAEESTQHLQRQLAAVHASHAAIQSRLDAAVRERSEEHAALIAERDDALAAQAQLTGVTVQLRSEAELAQRAAMHLTRTLEKQRQIHAQQLDDLVRAQRERVSEAEKTRARLTQALEIAVSDASRHRENSEALEARAVTAEKRSQHASALRKALGQARRHAEITDDVLRRAQADAESARASLEAAALELSQERAARAELSDAYARLEARFVQQAQAILEQTRAEIEELSTYIQAIQSGRFWKFKAFAGRVRALLRS